MRSPTWQVRIRYREPGYELRRGVARLYSGTFVVEAASADDAERAGMGQFRAMETESGVGWYREVVRVEVTRLEGCKPSKGERSEACCQARTVSSVVGAMDDDRAPAEVDQ